MAGTRRRRKPPQNGFRRQLRAQLPRLLREDPALRQKVEEILGRTFPLRAEIGELRALREDFHRFAEEATRRFEAMDQRFIHLEQEMDRRFQAMDQRFVHLEQEMDRRFQAMDQRFVHLEQEMDRRFQAMDQRFVDLRQEMDQRFLEARQESDKRFESILKELRTERLHLSRLSGRLGYGLEYLVRELVEEFAGKSLVRSERLVLQDREGEVFGVPAEIEFDLFASDGEAYLCEVKSHIEPDDVLVFNRKADFAAKHIGKPFTRLMIGASMEKTASQLMKSLRIESIVRAVIEEPPEPSS